MLRFSIPRTRELFSSSRGAGRGLRLSGVVLLLIAGTALSASPLADPSAEAFAQERTGGAPAETAPRDTVSISLNEAVQIAMEQNYAIRGSRLDVENANAQIRSAWGSVYPQVAFSTNYQRNVRTSNPFAGSSAGNIFASFGAIDWLRFNESARADGNPQTEPITLEEFRQRQQQGYREAGIDPTGGGGNPFGVANQFTSGLDVSQTLFSDQAFTAIRTAQTLKSAHQHSLDRRRRETVHEVRTAFYAVLLARERAAIVRQSLERTRRTLREARQRVERGAAPKMQRLSAEVDLANLRTELIQAENEVEQARNRFKHTIGMAVDRPIRLRGELEAPEELGDDPARSTAAVQHLALEQRADLERARLNVDLETARREAAEAGYMPRVEAFASLGLSGRVPDDRTQVLSDPNDPFQFSTRTNDVFSNQYWENSVAVGLRVSWDLFTGFQTQSQVEQAQISINRARLQRERLEQSVRLEVRQAVQNLEAARQRIESQRQNLETAELNYEYASTRLEEGMATPLEERNASEQLDQTRLSYLQAVHDFLVARSNYELATGRITDGRPDLDAPLDSTTVPSTR